MNSILERIYFFDLSHLPKYSNSQKRIQRLKLINYFLVFSVPVIILNDIVRALSGDEPYTFEKYPVVVFWILCLFALVLTKRKAYFASKLIIIFGPLVFITIYSLTGYIIGEHFLWQPIMVLGVSIIPFLVLDVNKERKWLVFSFIFFLCYIIFHDKLLLYGTDGNRFGPLFEKLNTTPFIYFAVKILIFIFLASVTFYSIRLNEYQHELNQKTNQSLQETTEFLEKVNAELQAQRDAINNSASMLVFNEHQEIVSVNKIFLQVSGFQEDVLIGKSLSKLILSNYDSDFYKAILEAIEETKTWRGELKLKRDDDTSFWMETAISAIHHSGQKRSGLLVIMFNISKLKDDEERLEKLNIEKDRILYAVAHDLKNPLLNFKALLDLIRSGAISKKEEEEVFNLMTKDCNHATNLIAELLEIGRLEDDKFVLEKSETDLHDFLEKSFEQFDQSMSKKKISLKKSFDNKIQSVWINENEFLRVVYNLMSNAVKFTPEAGEITVTTRQLNQRISIDIRDTGVGIASELLPIIFDKFSKAARLGVQGEKSTGLGMWIVKHIIKLHGGEITVQSKVGQGTQFTITLPEK